MKSGIVEKNRFGYYEVKDKPSIETLKKYYAEKYYQFSTSTSYQKSYSDAEITYIKNKLEQKYLVTIPLLNPASASAGTFLDVGAGEGWALAQLKEKGWRCTGLDYSEFGCRAHNPGSLQDLIVGDIYDELEKLINEGRRFDLVLLDNVLEHVIDPFGLLMKTQKLISDKGILIIEVPNDFSVVQKHLVANGHVSREFWIGFPDHLSYFNRDGLVSLCDAAGWEMKKILGDFPIDFFLCHESTNYVEDKAAGKACHRTRIELDNLMHALSPEKTNIFYEALAGLGMGRGIIGFFQQKPSVREASFGRRDRE